MIYLFMYFERNNILFQLLKCSFKIELLESISYLKVNY